MRVAVLFEGEMPRAKEVPSNALKNTLNPDLQGLSPYKTNGRERGQWYFRRYIKELPNPRNFFLIGAGLTERW